MVCAWKELMQILPQWMRDVLADDESAGIQEIRMRSGSPPELITARTSRWLQRCLCREDLESCIRSASRYSPWAAATISQGYLTAPGGHRIGVCGEAVVRDGCFQGIRTISSLCIRVARDVPGIAERVYVDGQSVMILGAPGWGKTTLLRDLARQIAKTKTVCVIDERQELFPPGFCTGKRMDILSGCPKKQGIEMALRTMRPDVIAVDEITAQEDCQALIRAFGCGVTLLATAHAAGIQDFGRRTIYEELRMQQIFDTILALNPDKTFHAEAAECTSNGLGRH